MGNPISVPVRDQSSGAPRQLHINAEIQGGSSPERWRFEGFTLDLASCTLSDANGK